MGHSQGASLAGTVLWLLLSSMGREPRELITGGQNLMNGDAALLASFSLWHNVEPSRAAWLDNDPWVARGTHFLPRGRIRQGSSGSHSMGFKN